MNFLTGYDSSDDEDDSGEKQAENFNDSIKLIQKKQCDTSVKQATTSSSSLIRSFDEPHAPSKKKRAVIFSTLPVEIQNALARGSTSQDSDSDDDVPNVTVKSFKSKSFNGVGLISLLPVPKNSLVETMKETVSSKLRPLSEVQHPNQNVQILPHIVAASPCTGNPHENDFDEEVDDKLCYSYSTNTESGGSLFTLKSGFETKQEFPEPGASGPEVAFTFNRNLTLPSLSYAGSLNDSAKNQTSMNPLPDFCESYRGIGRETSSSSAPLAAFSINGVSLSVQHSSNSSSCPSSSSSSSIEPESMSDYGNINSSICRKKRERDIEQQLISGNLDAAQTMGGEMREMRAGNDWNAHAYTMQKQNEAELHRAFFAAKGGEKAIAPVSKLQGRKHQINSLVMQAAKTELALLNAKGDRNISKQETRSKYGW